MNLKITVTKPYIPKKENFDKFLNKIWDNKYLTNNGPLHKQFEKELKAYLKSDNITLTVNGHSALDIVEKGFRLEGEVITTPFTFVSTIHSLTLNGLKPVFCDIKESDLTIDENKIEELITDKTCAILPVHVYGHMCNVDKIEKIAKKHNLIIIYDAAHSFGTEYNGKSIANYGDASVFSFHATKLFNTIEGGAIVYNDFRKKRIFEAYKNFGIEGEEQIDYIGLNAKMNEFQAAMGLTNLPLVSTLIKERKKLTEFYRNNLKDVPGLKMFYPEKINSKFKYNYSYFPVLIESELYGYSRDELYDYLKQNNIYSRKYFYPLITEIGCYKGLYNDANLKNAKKISDMILCLPLYNELSKKNVIYICDLIKRFGEDE